MNALFSPVYDSIRFRELHFKKTSDELWSWIYSRSHKLHHVRHLHFTSHGIEEPLHTGKRRSDGDLKNSRLRVARDVFRACTNVESITVDDSSKSNPFILKQLLECLPSHKLRRVHAHGDLDDRWVGVFFSIDWKRFQTRRWLTIYQLYAASVPTFIARIRWVQYNIHIWSTSAVKSQVRFDDMTNTFTAVNKMHDTLTLICLVIQSASQKHKFVKYLAECRELSSLHLSRLFKSVRSSDVRSV